MIRNKFIIMWSVIFLFLFTGLFIFQQKSVSNDTLTVSGHSHLSINFLENFGSFELERTDGGYYSFIDNKTKEEIDRTARGVFVGDQLILGNNALYEVEKIEEDKVYCKYKGEEDISWMPDWDKAVIASNTQMTVQNKKRAVAIYSTHTAESYVPTSGKDSEPGKGDILSVAREMATVLEKQGINAVFSDNKHDPHDANAYQRSRRTAAQLLKNRPATIIDVHRDGVPDPKFYATKIDGQDATQVRLVVGRQNQNMQANLDYAKKLKAFYDKKQPGLIKGIFIAKGNYNQDLAPRSILVEVGTHTNSLEAASKGAATFASFLPEFLGLETAAGPNNTANKGSNSSILWILAVFVIGAIGFLLISTGSVKGSVNKVRNIGKEFTSYFGNKKRN